MKTRDAVVSIQQIGGFVDYVYWPSWLKLSGHVEGVYADYTVASDTQMKALSCFPMLRILKLRSTRVTGTSLEYIARPENVVMLDLGETMTGDEIWGQLRSFTSLRALFIDKTNVTDSGIQHVNVSPFLECVAIDGTAITKDGVLQLLDKLPHCCGLSVTEMPQLNAHRSSLAQACDCSRLLWGADKEGAKTDKADKGTGPII